MSRRMESIEVLSKFLLGKLVGNINAGALMYLNAGMCWHVSFIGEILHLFIYVLNHLFIYLQK